MSYRIAPAAQCLLDQASALWPNRSRASDGTIGDTSHAARASDHNPDSRGIVHAADLTHDPANGCDNNVLSERIKGDPRVKYVIWNRRIWNPSISRTWRPYTGTNPHDHHMHVSVLTERENDTSPWFTTNPTPTGGFGTMDDKQITKLFEDVAAQANARTQAITSKIEASERRTRRLLKAVARRTGMTDDEIMAVLNNETP